MTLPRILFFARGYQADYFPTLTSDRYEAIFVTLTRAERAQVERRGAQVAACFEEDFERLPVAEVPEGYLRSSLAADRFLGRFPDAERRTILGKEIAFWSELLDRVEPAAVVNELVAIEISEVLLIESERRGIAYLAGMNCVVEDYFYWLTNPLSLSGRFLADAEPDDTDRALAKAYADELFAKDYRPFYVKNLSGRRALKPLLVSIAKMLVWKARRRWPRRFRYEDYDEEYSKKVAVYLRSLFLKYDRLEDIPAAREVIFYPLHQEPEATLNYMSEFYANQVATIENILKCLTADQVLVVKEHPVDKGSLLRDKFRDIRRQYSNLYYLPAELHGREVLRRATRVVTLTSTVGWEALAIGYPVYVMGQIFYDSVQGATAVANWNELKALLRRPSEAGDALPRDRLEAFVARMNAASYRGNPFPHDALYSEDNRQRVIEAIIDGAGL